MFLKILEIIQYQPHITLPFFVSKKNFEFNFLILGTDKLLLTLLNQLCKGQIFPKCVRLRQRRQESVLQKVR